MEPAGEGGETALFFEGETLDVRRGFDDLLPDLDRADEAVDLKAERLKPLRPTSSDQHVAKKWRRSNGPGFPGSNFI